MEKTTIEKVYILPGQPHVLLSAESSPQWSSLRKSFDGVREEIESSNADLILYFSTQWLSVLGYMLQSDPNPKGVHVDGNWHHLGSMSYDFSVDTEFSKVCAEKIGSFGHLVKNVCYEGFPVDTGTIVAQKLINPHNKFPVAMVSCNIYSEKQETVQIGQACAQALAKQNKKAIVVLVSSLSARFSTKEILPKEDMISSATDEHWNKKILNLLSQGDLKEVSELAVEFGQKAHADLGFKGAWWLSGISGQQTRLRGKVFDYQPVWGTGAALVGLYPC